MDVINPNSDYNIYIGGKPLMNYATAVVIQFTTKNASKVIVKSRGKFISRAVDVVEIVKNRFLKDQIKVDSININSEGFVNREGRPVRVSTMEIVLGKK